MRRLPPVVLAALVGVVGAFEGVRYVAYEDPVGIPTICMGATAGVQLGDTATPAECDAMLREDLEEAAKVLPCFHRPLTPGQTIAVVSWAYNVGPYAACRSTLVRLANEGKPPEVWCAQLDKWVYAKRLKLPGLVKRRAEERAFCEGRRGY